MGRNPRIPPEFKRRPFTLVEAQEAGLSRHCLRGKTWRRIGFGLYQWSEMENDLWLTLSAWQRVLPPEAVFAGGTSAWLHGLDVEPTDPVEVVVPAQCGIRTRPGLLVHHSENRATEVLTIRGLRATALLPTLLRLCFEQPDVEALVAIDMAVHRRLASHEALISYAEAAAGRRGAAQMRKLSLLAAPAESPMETRLRWLLIRAGLPHPSVQADLRDASHRFVGRVDLYYPAARLAVEYDGGNHRERMVEDNRRQNVLLNCGYRLLRFTAADVRGRSDLVVAQVCAALEAAGMRVLSKTRVSHVD